MTSDAVISISYVPGVVFDTHEGEAINYPSLRSLGQAVAISCFGAISHWPLAFIGTDYVLCRDTEDNRGNILLLSIFRFRPIIPIIPIAPIYAGYRFRYP